MREFVVFFSWQSDTPRKVGSDFIRKALEQAVAALNEAKLDVQVRLDADTNDVPGTPPVTDTILEKIRDCDLFVGDVTLVGEVRGSDGSVVKLIPNPNVMAEFGYAIKAKGLRRILLVMNAAFGDFNALPFDMGHLRKPAEFNAAANIDDPSRRALREALAGRLIEYLKTAIVAALAAPAPDQVMHERARERLDEILGMGPIAAAPVLVSFPRAALHLVPLAAAQKSIAFNRVTDARPFLLPTDGAHHEAGVDHTEWWSHAPLQERAPLPNPVAAWCTRLWPDGAIEATWTLGVGDKDGAIKVDGCKLQKEVVARTSRFLQALRTLGFEHGALAHLSLLGLENVVLIGGQSVTRRLRVRNLGLPAAVLATLPEDLALTFEPAFERMWRAAGHESVSPC